jgi:predicted dinucleotide-binding enzyme
MATAIIGTGGLGSVIATLLAAGGEDLRLASADAASAEALAKKIGPAVVVAADNHGALKGADALILALRFTILQSVIDEVADALGDTVVIVPSNPVGLDAKGNVERLLPDGQASGPVVSGWLPPGAHFAMAFGTMSGTLLEPSANRSPEKAVLFYATDDARAGEVVERLIRTAGFDPVKAGGVDVSTRMEVGGDLHDLVVGPVEARKAVAHPPKS